MKPIDQTRTDPSEGNCLAACVASLLHLDSEDLPTFPDTPAWWDEFIAWLRPFGFYAARWGPGASEDVIPPGYAIASGESPRYLTLLHAVVYLDGKLAHDPHPDRAGIAGDVHDWIVLIPFDPGPRSPS